jgi:nicotinamide riboside kinase
MKRIAITGPESSGKTTLARSLAAAIGGEFVAEYARFGLKPEEEVSSSKLIALAQAQLTWLQEAASKGPEVLIADTEFIVYAIWHEEVIGTPMPGWNELFRAFPFDHFLLCAPDIPWEPDPLRVNPHDRHRLMKLYESRLKELGCPYTIISGPHPHRLQAALQIITQPTPSA